MNIYKNILSVHKPGGEPLDPQILKQLIEICELNIKQRVEQVRAILDKRESL